MGNAVEKCEGCLKINENGECTVYDNPNICHRRCECPAKMTKAPVKGKEKTFVHRKGNFPRGKFSGGLNFYWRSRNKKTNLYR